MHPATRRNAIHALAAIFLLLNALQQPMRADTESPRVVLTPAAKGLVVGPGMNAAGKDLRGCTFVGQDLAGAVFDGCNLYGVRIHQCGLRQASFRGAVFAGAEITDLWAYGGELSALEGADFTDATINGIQFWSYDFSTLQLSPQQLMTTWSYKSRDLHQCVVYGSDRSGNPVALDLRGVNLRQAVLRGDLSKCDFTDAEIRQTRWENFALAFGQLASTRDFKQRVLHVQFASGTRGGLLGERDFARLYLGRSDLGLSPPDANFTDARINGCILGLSKAQLRSTASYKEGNLTELQLVSSDLSDCDFSGMNLSGCKFFHCQFAGANFDDAVVTGASFASRSSIAESDRLTVGQIKSTWNYKHDRMKGIQLPEEITKALEAEGKSSEERPAAPQ